MYYYKGAEIKRIQVLAKGKTSIDTTAEYQGRYAGSEAIAP